MFTFVSTSLGRRENLWVLNWIFSCHKTTTKGSSFFGLEKTDSKPKIWNDNKIGFKKLKFNNFYIFGFSNVTLNNIVGVAVALHWDNYIF